MYLRVGRCAYEFMCTCLTVHVYICRCLEVLTCLDKHMRTTVHFTSHPTDSQPFVYLLNTLFFLKVFPEHKYLIVECLRELGYKTGMTGDGVNDAPALKRADVGVAVHGGTVLLSAGDDMT